MSSANDQKDSSSGNGDEAQLCSLDELTAKLSQLKLVCREGSKNLAASIEVTQATLSAEEKLKKRLDRVHTASEEGMRELIAQKLAKGQREKRADAAAQEVWLCRLLMSYVNCQRCQVSEAVAPEMYSALTTCRRQVRETGETNVATREV